MMQHKSQVLPLLFKCNKMHISKSYTRTMTLSLWVKHVRIYSMSFELYIKYLVFILPSKMEPSSINIDTYSKWLIPSCFKPLFQRISRVKLYCLLCRSSISYLLKSYNGKALMVNHPHIMTSKFLDPFVLPPTLSHTKINLLLELINAFSWDFP